tara:strand:+ start:929 stop:1267 length:339 start_codon:yes stop_codon:yes gene_type:complete
MNNISINYTVREDDLPKEISRLYRSVVSRLENLMEDMGDAEELLSFNEPENHFRVLQTLAEARDKMIAIDLNMADCQNIIAGYQKYLLEQMAGKLAEQQEQQLELELDAEKK